MSKRPFLIIDPEPAIFSGSFKTVRKHSNTVIFSKKTPGREKLCRVDFKALHANFDTIDDCSKLVQFLGADRVHVLHVGYLVVKDRDRRILFGVSGHDIHFAVQTVQSVFKRIVCCFQYALHHFVGRVAAADQLQNRQAEKERREKNKTVRI